MFSLLFPVPRPPPPFKPQPLQILPLPPFPPAYVSALTASDGAHGDWRTFGCWGNEFCCGYLSPLLPACAANREEEKRLGVGSVTGGSTYRGEIFTPLLWSALKLGPDVSLWEPPALERNSHAALQGRPLACLSRPIGSFGRIIIVTSVKTLLARKNSQTWLVEHSRCMMRTWLGL